MLDHEDPTVRVNAARALWRISGDVGAALPVLREAIDGDAWGRSHALAALCDLGPAGADLAGLLPPLFDSDDDWVSARSAAAHWYLTRDAAPVVPVLLRRLQAGRLGVEAVRCLGDMGPAAHVAIPVLRQGAGVHLPGATTRQRRRRGPDARPSTFSAG